MAQYGQSIMAFRHGRTFRKRRVFRRIKRRTRFSKKKFTRKTFRRRSTRRTYRHKRRRNLRGYGNTGNYYSRRFLLQYIVSHDLWNDGLVGNTTFNDSFTLRELFTRSGGTTSSEPGATAEWLDILAVSNMFQLARIKRARIVWETQGDRTNALYNVNTTGDDETVSFPNGSRMVTYLNPLDSVSAIYDPATSPPTATHAREDITMALGMKGAKTHSIWKGSRSFVPGLITAQDLTYLEAATSTTTALFNNRIFKPIRNKWVATSTNIQGGSTVTRNYLDLVYQGLRLNVPQVSKATTYHPTATTAANAALDGDYFFNAWIELDIEWKERSKMFPSATPYVIVPDTTPAPGFADNVHMQTLKRKAEDMINEGGKIAAKSFMQQAVEAAGATLPRLMKRDRSPGSPP